MSQHKIMDLRSANEYNTTTKLCQNFGGMEGPCHECQQSEASGDIGYVADRTIDLKCFACWLNWAGRF
ncbi:hypothetical protein MTO96_040294 [Rhipicephalus appendiculatus]